MARNIEHIVEEQALKWQALRRAAADRAPRAFEPAPPQPCITVSPEMGSLGMPVAQRAAADLGFDLFERELVDRIAQTAHVRTYLVESVDMHTQNAIENWVGRQLGRAFFAESDYVTNLSKVLLTLAQHGNAVIIGRGAQFILDPAHTLRIRVVAPIELRIDRVAKRDGIDRTDARSKILRVDSDRAAFVRRHFDEDIADPLRYDLVLSTEKLSAEACAGLVVSAYRSRFS